MHMLNLSKITNLRKIDKSEITDVERDMCTSYSRLKNKTNDQVVTLYMTQERINKYKQFGYPQLQLISKDV